MEFTCAVWYEGALAHYHVLETGANIFTIRFLNTITKTSMSSLPRKVNVYKSGGEWISDHHNPEFIGELVDTILANKTVGTPVADS